MAQYGCLKGMALPLLTFPFGLLGSLSVLLMPEITQAHIRGEQARLARLLDRMLRLTGCFSALAGALFWVWGEPLALLLYKSTEAGFYLKVLGPAMPLLYLESMVDGAMKGVGEQKAVFRYSLWDAVLRITGVVILLPRSGMKGFLLVILLSSLYTCAANTGRLLKCCGLRPAFWRWLGAPALARGSDGCRGGTVAPAASGRVAGGGNALAPACGAGSGRRGDDPAVRGGAVAAGAGRGAAGDLPGRKKPGEGRKNVRTMQMFWTRREELSIIQWISWRSRPRRGESGPPAEKNTLRTSSAGMQKEDIL